MEKGPTVHSSSSETYFIDPLLRDITCYSCLIVHVFSVLTPVDVVCFQGDRGPPGPPGSEGDRGPKVNLAMNPWCYSMK